MISQTAEYALRAVVFLAESGDTPQTIQQIARATQVPAGYLAKVMQELARAELVKSQRGLHGGFALLDAPSNVTVYQVVQAVDPIQRLRKCPLNKPAHCGGLCALHRRLDDAVGLIEQSFRDSTLADLLEQPIFASGPPEVERV